MTYVVGVDYAKPGGDMSCVVQGERDADGVVTIRSIRYFVEGVWIERVGNDEWEGMVR